MLFELNYDSKQSISMDNTGGTGDNAARLKTLDELVSISTFARLKFMLLTSPLPLIYGSSGNKLVRNLI